MPTTQKKQYQPKLPNGSIKLQLLGEMIRARYIGGEEEKYVPQIKAFEKLFENLANLEPKNRLLKYSIIGALILSAKAKAKTLLEERQKIYALKNQLFISLSSEYTQSIQISYLRSKRFFVRHCQNCIEKNSAIHKKRFLWNYCQRCEIDRNFFNVVCLEHKYSQGTAKIFLSHDKLNLIKNYPKKQGKLTKIKEEFIWEENRFSFNNLKAIDDNSSLKLTQLLNQKFAEKNSAGQEPSHRQVQRNAAEAHAAP